MNNRLLFRFVLVCLTVYSFSLAGCGITPQVATLESTQRAQILQQAEPIADNLFAGYESQQYVTFARDFDPAMRKAISEKAFSDWVSQVSEQLGAYQSRTVQSVERMDDIEIVVYQVAFEKEANATVRMSLHQQDGVYQVSGLWLDAPILRRK